MITYYWPPCGGVPVQRWLKLSRGLLRIGWQATILTTENGDYPYLDESQIDKYPREINVCRAHTPSYKKLFWLLLGKSESLPSASLKTTHNDTLIKRIVFWGRRNFIAPDMRRIWNSNAYKAAKELLKKDKFEAIITTGPPHSTHLIGMQIKKKFGLKWIADFRDPWTNITYNANEKRNFIIKYLDAKYERKVLTKADVVVTVSDVFSQNLSIGKRMTIPNAFDPEEFAHIIYKRSDVFRIKYIGTLPEGRMKPALEAVNWLLEYNQRRGINRNIEITFVGTFQNESLEFKEKIINIPFVEYHKALEHTVNSEILLLFINREKKNTGILTHKLYDYIGSKTFIIAVGPKNTELEAILKNSQAGVLIDYHEKDKFMEVLDDIYQKWCKGDDLKNKNDVSEYSVINSAEKYEDILLQTSCPAPCRAIQR